MAARHRAGGVPCGSGTTVKPSGQDGAQPRVDPSEVRFPPIADLRRVSFLAANHRLFLAHRRRWLRRLSLSANTRRPTPHTQNLTPASTNVLVLFMHELTATAERREEILGELAEWMHAAAREAQRRLLEAETTDDFVKLTASLAKLARGVRQSILIHRKLETERLEAARRADDAAAGAQAGSEFVPRHHKRVRIRTAITRHVWNRLEGVEAELLHEDL